MLDRSPAGGWADAYRTSRRRYIPPHYFVPWTRAPLHALVRLAETERAEQALARLGEQGREHGEVRIAAAALRLLRVQRPLLPLAVLGAGHCRGVLVAGDSRHVPLRHAGESRRDAGWDPPAHLGAELVCFPARAGRADAGQSPGRAQPRAACSW